MTDLSSVIETKEMDINNNKEQQNAMKTILSNLITHCEELYNDYDVSRIQVILHHLHSIKIKITIN